MPLSEAMPLRSTAMQWPTMVQQASRSRCTGAPAFTCSERALSLLLDQPASKVSQSRGCARPSTGTLRHLLRQNPPPRISCDASQDTLDDWCTQTMRRGPSPSLASANTRIQILGAHIFAFASNGHDIAPAQGHHMPTHPTAALRPLVPQCPVADRVKHRHRAGDTT